MTPHVLCFLNEVGAIWVQPAYVRMQYRPGRRRFTDFQTTMQHLHAALAHNGSGRCLVDQRAMHPFTIEELTYLLYEWLPRAVAEAGYHFGAVLPPLNMLAGSAQKAALEQARNLAAASLSMTYRYFADEAEAVAWLRTC